jgi:hypothetical protein
VLANLVECYPLNGQVRNIGHLFVGKHAVLEQKLRADQELVAGEGRDRGIR